MIQILKYNNHIIKNLQHKWSEHELQLLQLIAYILKHSIRYSNTAYGNQSYCS